MNIDNEKKYNDDLKNDDQNIERDKLNVMIENSINIINNKKSNETKQVIVSKIVEKIKEILKDEN